MDRDMHTKLDHYLKEVCLTTVRKRYIELAQKARQEGLSYEQYLFLVIQAENETRKNRRIERWLKESRLPLGKSLDTFLFKHGQMGRHDFDSGNLGNVFGCI